MLRTINTKLDTNFEVMAREVEAIREIVAGIHLRMEGQDGFTEVIILPFINKLSLL